MGFACASGRVLNIANKLVDYPWGESLEESGGIVKYLALGEADPSHIYFLMSGAILSGVRVGIVASEFVMGVDLGRAFC